MKITPTKITKFNRTLAELQSFWIFGIIVAGRNSDFAARCVANVLSRNRCLEPFTYFRKLGEIGIHNLLVANKVGQYTRITRAIVESLDVDLRKANVNELMAVHGVGSKTARFFLLHSRRNVDVAVLDTHVLAWMRKMGMDAPDKTPTNLEEYGRLERLYILMRNAHFPSMSPAQADLLIWSVQSGRTTEEPQINLDAANK